MSNLDPSYLIQALRGYISPAPVTPYKPPSVGDGLDGYRRYLAEHDGKGEPLSFDDWSQKVGTIQRPPSSQVPATP